MADRLAPHQMISANFPLKGIFIVLVSVNSIIIAALICATVRRSLQMKVILNQMVARERSKQDQRAFDQERAKNRDAYRLAKLQILQQQADQEHMTQRMQSEIDLRNSALIRQRKLEELQTQQEQLNTERALITNMQTETQNELKQRSLRGKKDQQQLALPPININRQQQAFKEEIKPLHLQAKRTSGRPKSSIVPRIPLENSL